MPDPALITGRLNVPDYVEARKSDIKRLEELVLKTGSNSKKRAFQSLPRIERRRAASHDPKRVPRKRGLRKRAIFEDIREAAKKQKVRKRVITGPNPPRDNSQIDICTQNRKVTKSDLAVLNLKYEKRQRDKTWLPTHIWHRKRAFLTNISGILVPQTATQKQYRKTYRIATHIDETGAMAWDTSYLATIIARHDHLTEVLKPFVSGSLTPLYQSGQRNWQGQFQNEGPVLVHWFAAPAAATIQCHPTLFDTIWDILALAGVELQDCRFAIGSIDLLGSKSLKIINGLSRNSEPDWPFREMVPYRAAMNKYFSDPRAVPHGKPDQQLPDSNACVYAKEQRVASLNSLWSQSAVDQENAQGKPYPIDQNIPITIFALDDGRLRLLMPRNWVLPFWLMIHKGKHVLIGGQQELHQIAFEHGKPFFPNDFVHTPAGQKYNELKAEESRDIYFKKPSSKRPDLSKDDGNPFRIVDFDLLNRDSKLNHIKLEALERGVPKPGARIYGANQIGTDEHGCVSSDKMGPLIGFVTSGDFALSEAKGAGIGLTAEITHNKLCLVKNVGSQSSFLSKMTLIRP